MVLRAEVSGLRTLTPTMHEMAEMMKPTRLLTMTSSSAPERVWTCGSVTGCEVVTVWRVGIGGGGGRLLLGSECASGEPFQHLEI
jgi:hypothetical protein